MTGRRNPISTDAGAIAEQLRKKRTQRKMPSKERQEARRQESRVRAYYDVPQEVKDGVTGMAEQEGLSAGAIASLLLADGLRRYREGRITLNEGKRIKVRNPSPRCIYTVEDELVLAVLRDGGVLSSDG